MSNEDAPDRRDGDRRSGQGGYDGPERRIGDRRVPISPPEARIGAAALSDIELVRAYHRAETSEADLLRVEIQRRGLDI